MSLLSDRNFAIEKRGETNVLKLVGSNGAMFVYFASKECPNCRGFDPVWKSIQSDTRVKYAVAYNDVCMSTISRSQSTTTPIAAVPRLIMFNNGYPNMIFNSPRTPENIRGFIESFFARIAAKSQHHPSGSGGFGIPNAGGGGMGLGMPSQVPGGFNMGLNNAFGTAALKTNNGYQPSDIQSGENHLLNPPEIVPKNTPWRTDNQ